MKSKYIAVLASLFAVWSICPAQTENLLKLKANIDSTEKENNRRQTLEKENEAGHLNKLLEDAKQKLTSGEISQKKYDKKIKKIKYKAEDVLISAEDAKADSPLARDKICIYTYINDSLKEKKCFDSTLVKPQAAKNSFYFRIYNDAQGINTEQPNGLIQTEISYSWNCEKWIGPLWRNTTCTLSALKNIILPTINLFQNKRDSSYRYTPIHYDKSIPLTDTAGFKSTLNIHTINLVRYAHYSVSGKLNILTFECKNKCFSLFIDLFGTFYSTGVGYDSTAYKLLRIKKEDARFQVYSAGGGLSGKLMIKPPHSNFSLEASLSSFNLLLLNNDINQSYGKLYSPNYNAENYKKPLLTFFNGQSLGRMSIYNIELRYSSTMNLLKKDNTGTFLRFSFFTNPIPSLLGKPSTNYGNSYVQIQLGISKTLEQLLDFLGVKK